MWGGGGGGEEKRKKGFVSRPEVIPVLLIVGIMAALRNITVKLSSRLNI